MKNPFSPIILTGLLASTLILGGCRRKAAPDMRDADLRKWKGDIVQVQFRRDALGSAHQLPVSPTTSSINGAQVSMTGELTDIGPLGVVLKVRESPHWIPRESILLIKFEREGK